MNSIDKLRELLKEAGIEYYKHEEGEPLRELEKAEAPATSWRMGNASCCAILTENGTFDLWIDHASAEQAAAIAVCVRGDK